MMSCGLTGGRKRFAVTCQVLRTYCIHILFAFITIAIIFSSYYSAVYYYCYLLLLICFFFFLMIHDCDYD